MEDDAMATGASCEVVVFFYMEDVQHDLSGWIQCKLGKYMETP